MTERASRPDVSSYSASWVDRLTLAARAGTISPGIIYGLISLFLVALFSGVQWLEGAYRQTGYNSWHVFIALQPLYPIAAIHYLDNVARTALERFRPAFVGDESDFREAAYKLTTMPARGATYASLLGLFSSILLFGLVQDIDTTYNLVGLSVRPLAQVLFLAYILAAWFGFGAWVFHTIRQLMVINELYTLKAKVDPSFPEPLHALSAISSRTSILILVNTYGWFGVNTAGGSSAPTQLVSLIITNLFFIGLGLVIFIWPLWGAHQLLEQAKGVALAKNSQCQNLAIENLHQRVKSGMLADVDGWETALSGLHLERLQLQKVATWPWAPEAMRNFLLALVVPILVWFAQFGLQRLLE